MSIQVYHSFHMFFQNFTLPVNYFSLPPSLCTQSTHCQALPPAAPSPCQSQCSGLLACTSLGANPFGVLVNLILHLITRVMRSKGREGWGRRGRGRREHRLREGGGGRDRDRGFFPLFLFMYSCTLLTHIDFFLCKRDCFIGSKFYIF